MSQFWLFAGVLSLVAVVFVVWPLLRSTQSQRKSTQQDFLLDLFNESRQEIQSQLESAEITQDQYQQLMVELEQSLLDDSAAESIRIDGVRRWPLWLFAVLIAGFSVIFYWQRGAMPDVKIQQLLEQRFQQQMTAMQSGDSEADAATEELMVLLQSRVDARPEQRDNRYLLARLGAESGRYGVAVQNYTRLLQEAEEPDPRMMAELAQVVFLAAGNRVTPEVSALVSKTLELNSNETTALGLAGIEAFELGRFQDSVDYWKRAIAQMPANSPVVQGLMGGVKRAQAMLAGSDGVVPSIEGGDVLSVDVRLAEGLEVDAGAHVLVYAREWGAKMPLAISRFSVSSLPKVVLLDKAMSMMPGTDITTVDQLEVVVRISKTGSATPQSGDWQNSVGPVVLDDGINSVSIIVSQQLP